MNFCYKRMSCEFRLPSPGPLVTIGADAPLMDCSLGYLWPRLLEPC